MRELSKKETYERTIDGRYMVLVDGVQWGPIGSERDGDGSSGATFSTKQDAKDAFDKDEEKLKGV